MAVILYLFSKEQEALCLLTFMLAHLFLNKICYLKLGKKAKYLYSKITGTRQIAGIPQMISRRNLNVGLAGIFSAVTSLGAMSLV